MQLPTILFPDKMEDLKLEDEEAPPPILGIGPLLGLLADREMGLLGRGRKVKAKKAKELLPESEEIAEERLISKDPLGIIPCKLSGNFTRSTFLMVFSPDKELLASTHGDHNIYISEVKTGECIKILKGHPRLVGLIKCFSFIECIRSECENACSRPHFWPCLPYIFGLMNQGSKRYNININ